MAKDKGRKYRQYRGPQTGSPMWRDPAHTGRGGCLGAVVGLAALVTTVGGVVVHLV
jgi:hypothetical protein